MIPACPARHEANRRIGSNGSADIVIGDLASIRDNATVVEPHQYSEGVENVLVDGVALGDAGKSTWALPRRVITR